MIVVREPISLAELIRMAEARFGNLVKAVVDIERRIIAVDAELHSDQEAALLEAGSKQENLWGINLYPGLPEEDWIGYDSMINLRPGLGNRTRGVDDPDIRSKIVAVVKDLVGR